MLFSTKSDLNSWQRTSFISWIIWGSKFPTWTATMHEYDQILNGMFHSCWYVSLLKDLRMMISTKGILSLLVWRNQLTVSLVVWRSELQLNYWIIQALTFYRFFVTQYTKSVEMYGNPATIVLDRQLLFGSRERISLYCVLYWCIRTLKSRCASIETLY